MGPKQAIRKQINTKCWRGCGATGTLTHCWMGMQNGAATLKDSLAVS